jgi:hypothetical protein
MTQVLLQEFLSLSFFNVNNLESTTHFCVEICDYCLFPMNIFGLPYQGLVNVIQGELML